MVSAYDGADRIKQKRAHGILVTGGWIISTQVMQEFFVTVTRRLAVPLSHQDALTALKAFATSAVKSVDAELTVAAAETADAHQLSFWDALIIEAAAHTGCRRLLTEDLSDGQTIRGVRIENPFV